MRSVREVRSKRDKQWQTFFHYDLTIGLSFFYSLREWRKIFFR